MHPLSLHDLAVRPNDGCTSREPAWKRHETNDETGRPERVPACDARHYPRVLDSDLDWGQDLFALRDELRARNVNRLSIAYFGMTRACEHGMPELLPLRRTPRAME